MNTLAALATIWWKPRTEFAALPQSIFLKIPMCRSRPYRAGRKKGFCMNVVRPTLCPGIRCGLVADTNKKKTDRKQWLDGSMFWLIRRKERTGTNKETTTLAFGKSL